MKFDKILPRYLLALIMIPLIYVGIKSSFNQGELVSQIEKENNIKDQEKKLVFNQGYHPFKKMIKKRNRLDLLFETLPRKKDYNPKQSLNTSNEILEFGRYYSKLERIFSKQEIQPFLKKCNNDTQVIKVIRDFCKLKLSK